MLKFLTVNMERFNQVDPNFIDRFVTSAYVSDQLFDMHVLSNLQKPVSSSLLPTLSTFLQQL
jgi:hypothetical protein